MAEAKDQKQSDMSDRDLLDIHRAVLREPPDPGEGRERGPWWLWTGIILTIFAGGFYLGRYGGAFFQNVVHVGYIEPWLPMNELAVLQQAGDERSADSDDLMSLGERVYAANCVACHLGSGEGLAGAFPPLVNSEWVTGDPIITIKIIAHGMMGPVEVRGASFDGVMPGWAVSLSPAEIAAVATYIRNNWGNEAEAVDIPMVEELLQQIPARGPWTAEELLETGGEP